MKTKKNKWTVKLNSLKTLMLATGIIFALHSANAQCVPAPSGLIAWWSSDGTTLDVVGTNNGVLQNGATYAPGIVGQAFSLDGIDDFVEIASSAALNFAPGSTGTIEFWFYRTKAASPEHFLGKRTDCSGPGGFNYQCAYDASVPPPPPLSQWIHFAQVYATNGVFVYTNGVQWYSSPGTFGATNTASLRIGTSDSCLSSATFGGLIDEVCIYNRALTTNEIEAIYQAGSAGKCKLLFSSQPQSQVGFWGKSVTFSVTVGGIPPFGYQWYFGTNQVPNATNSVLVLTNLQFTDAGSYSIVLSNFSGSITSNPANLTVNPAGVAIALYPGVSIDGVVGHTYGIQFSTNLADTNDWIGVTNLTFAVPTEIWYDSVPASLQKRFYRVLPGPIPIP